VERIGLIELDDRNHGEYYLAQLAVDNVPSVPFHVHKSVREKFPKEEDFMAYLERMAKAVIARCGDARNPLPQELVEGAT
jgi:Leu/Phe-tRNA-protein transferase